MRKQALFFAGVAAVSIAVMSPVGAAEYGTGDEALVMLKHAVTEVKADKAAALDKFNFNRAGFRDRDLFVFCFGASDGRFTAHEALVASDVRKLRDANGKFFGADMFRKAEEGRIAEIMYAAPVPGTSALADRRAYVTRVGDQVCGVSAFEFTAAP